VSDDDRITARRYALGMLLLCHSQITQRSVSVMRRDLGLRDPIIPSDSFKQDDPVAHTDELRPSDIPSGCDTNDVLPHVEVLGERDGGVQASETRVHVNQRWVIDIKLCTHTLW
jgi:hypothetical protein